MAVDGGKAPLALGEPGPERSTSAIGDDESEDGILPLKLVKGCTYQFVLQTFLSFSQAFHSSLNHHLV